MKPIPKEFYLSELSLDFEPGKGNSLTHFVEHGLEVFAERVVKPSRFNKNNRHHQIICLAKDQYLDAVLMLQIIRLLRRVVRLKQKAA